MQKDILKIFSIVFLLSFFKPSLSNAMINNLLEEQTSVQKQKESVTSKPLVEENSEFSWELPATEGSVLGISKKQQSPILCQFTYSQKTKTSKKVFCELPKLDIQEAILYYNTISRTISATVFLQRDLNIQIDEYSCCFDILNPSTWFKCEEKFVRSRTKKLSPQISMSIYKDNKIVPIQYFKMSDNVVNLKTKSFTGGKDFRIGYSIRLLDSEYGIQVLMGEQSVLKDLKKVSLNKETPKPFVFPFGRTVGVTQWYGFTDYQHPHTGIDFGVYKELVLATGDGEIVGKGWDSYYGDCLSGGNFLKIRHSDGMYSVYFHLEESYVNTGDKVKKGTIIAKSGNSGAWNCQKLGYHLHLETRKTASSSTHTNPTNYIQIDWGTVPTLDKKSFPGRLSGENPHPGF